MEWLASAIGAGAGAIALHLWGRFGRALSDDVLKQLGAAAARSVIALPDGPDLWALWSAAINGTLKQLGARRTASALNTAALGALPVLMEALGARATAAAARIGR